jgi:hypothetical protein
MTANHHVRASRAEPPETTCRRSIRYLPKRKYGGDSEITTIGHTAGHPFAGGWATGTGPPLASSRHISPASCKMASCGAQFMPSTAAERTKLPRRSPSERRGTAIASYRMRSAIPARLRNAGRFCRSATWSWASPRVEGPRTIVRARQHEPVCGEAD